MLRLDIQQASTFIEDASEFVQGLESLLQAHCDDPRVAAIQDEWLSMLAWSGADPDPDHRDSLFGVHTLLVLLAQAILNSLSSGESLTFDIDMGWPRLCGADGIALTARIVALASDHDWECEALGALHHSLIPTGQRKSLGEHYTPKWLAEALSLELLDDAWISEAITNALSDDPAPGVRVLDPTCGSGVLLVHAIRHLRASRLLRQRGLSSVAEADVLSSLIVGMDIHPVSVEIARASIALALGAWPTKGLRALAVHWGDALQSDPVIRLGDDRPLTSEMALPLLMGEASPQAPVVRIPRDVVESVDGSSFSAHSPPEGVAAEVEAAFSQTPNERSGWLWRLSASLNAGRLALAGCDRIITNPPWVRMNLFPEGPQKCKMTALAGHLSLWGSGNTNSAFNVAAIFVRRCLDLYLKSNGRSNARGAWILPSGAVSSDTWHETRLAMGRHSTAFWDLSNLKRRPFPGATSCVWLLDHPPTPIRHEQTQVRSAHNRQGHPVVHADLCWEAVSQLIEWRQADHAPIMGSGRGAYEGAAQFGASLYPSNLVRIQSLQEHHDGSSSIVTLTARHDPWKTCGQLRGDVPSEWIYQAAAATHLSAFWTRGVPIVLPLTADGGLDHDQMSSTDYWHSAEALWDAYRGAGAGTPKTLWDRLDHHKRVSCQVAAMALGKFKVICNSAGEYLRAARIPSEVIADNSTYFLLVDTPEESAYLASILNSGPLQTAHREIRESDRQCAASFWGLAPIPRFDPERSLHKRLAGLCEAAESLVHSVSVDHSKQWDEWGQVKRSHMARAALTREGLQGEIDEAAHTAITHLCASESGAWLPWDEVNCLPLARAALSDGFASALA